MAEYLFPFDVIPKGSDIIIYAMGVVGQCFFEQVTKLRYCNVVALIDRDADEFFSNQYRIEPLSALPQYAFDYIVIAIYEESIAHAVRKELIINYGVPSEKIIWERPEELQENKSLYRLGRMIKGHRELSLCLEDFMKRGNGDIASFAGAIEELKSYSYTNTELCEKHKEYFMQYLEKETSPKKRIILLRFLYEAGCFDGKCAELFMRSIRDIKGNYEARIWLTWDISCMEARMSSIRYNNFFLDKREIIRENISPFVNTAGRKVYIGERQRRDKKYIAVVGHNFDWTPSSHFKFMRPYVNEMCAQGHKIKIFPIDLLRYREGESFLRPIVMLDKRSYLARQEYSELLAPEIEVVIPEGATMQERIEHFTENLYAFQPDIVYDFSGEYAFCSPIYYDAFPTVAMPMRGYASSAWFDKYVARDKKICIEENLIFHSVSEEQMEEALPDLCKYSIPDSRPFDRSEHGFKEDAFLIVTSGYRLRQELTKEFADSVCSFLKEHTDAVWLLVGDAICDYIKLAYAALLDEKRIIEWGFEPDLYGLYGMCDIFWNPDRNGAAGCIYMAMQCGIPIVSSAFPSDILPQLGRENAVDGDYSECKKYADLLYTDKEMRKEKGKLMLERTRNAPGGVENYVKKIIEVGESILKQRQEPPALTK